ncbi:MAG: hypothetical protein IPM46_05065 [Flavobacteriales bacterium]|nr:hypothetical protein [Flavobacteriales bacterium]
MRNQALDRRQEIRDDLKFSNELINHRLTWFGALQGLLFAALAFIWGTTGGENLRLVLCLLGSTVSVSIGLGTLGANRMIETLEQDLEACSKEGSQTPVRRNRVHWWWWLMPGYFLPWVFLFSWVAIIILQLASP